VSESGAARLKRMRTSLERLMEKAVRRAGRGGWDKVGSVHIVQVDGRRGSGAAVFTSTLAHLNVFDVAKVKAMAGGCAKHTRLGVLVFSSSGGWMSTIFAGAAACILHEKV